MAGLLSNIFNKRWTISDIMNVDADRQQKASSCSVHYVKNDVELVTEGIVDKFKRFFTRNKSVMNVMYVIFEFQVSSDTGHSYKVQVRTQYDPDSILLYQNSVQIYCECADFKFKSAWQLGQHKALFRSDRTELELGPAITNAPKRKPGTTLCKHSYAAIMFLTNNYNWLMRNV